LHKLKSALLIMKKEQITRLKLFTQELKMYFNLIT